MRHFDPNNDVEFSNFGGSLSERQVVESTCPLLDGVVNTPWGAVSAGNLIAGIAAGAQPQQVNIYELVRDSTLNYRSVQQTVNSLFPATLSGMIKSYFRSLVILSFSFVIYQILSVLILKVILKGALANINYFLGSK